MGHPYNRSRNTASDPIAMTQDSPGAINARANGASIVQVDVGVSRFAAILLFATALISAGAFIGLWFTRDELQTVKAKYEVLQYDHQAMKAQLVARGLYEGTEH